MNGAIPWPAVVMALGGVLSIIGAVWAALQTASSETELRGKSDEIARLSGEVLGLTTGGDSFCYLSIDATQAPPFSGRDGYFAGRILQQGGFPMHDITVTLMDYTAAWNVQQIQEQGGRVSAPLSQIPVRREGKYRSGAPYDYAHGEGLPPSLGPRDEIVVGSLGIGHHYQLSPELPVGDPDRQDYWVVFHARNGIWLQELMLRRSGQFWSQAIQVTRDRKVILEQVDPQYPRDEDGRVQWGAGMDRLFERDPGQNK